MAIEEMVLLNMTFDCEDLYKVLFQLKGSKNFYPQSASKFLKKDFLETSNNKYTPLLDHLIQIASDIELSLNNDFPYEYSLNFELVNKKFNELEMEIKKIKNIQQQLITEKKENEKTYALLKCLTSSRMNLDQLNECSYIVTRFGRIKKTDIENIKYYENYPYIFYKLGEDDQYVWCCYVVTKDLQLKVDNIFIALGFEEIKIPSFVHGTIEEAKKELKDEICAMNEYIMRIEQKKTILRESNKIDLLIMYSTISFLHRIEEYKVFVVDYQSQYAIYGFISRRILNEFKERFKDIKSIKYQEFTADILDNNLEVPVITHNSKVIKPFELLSHINQLDKIDLTFSYALLYYTVFLIFLGDLGVGAMLMLFGLLSRKKKMGTLILSLGIAAMLGGLMYGNLFYTFHLYPNVLFPIATISRIVLGLVLLIIGTMTIRSIGSMSRKSSIIERVLSIKGICGLIVLYTIVIYFGFTYGIHMNLSYIPFLVISAACLILILTKTFVKKWLLK